MNPLNQLHHARLFHAFILFALAQCAHAVTTRTENFDHASGNANTYASASGMSFRGASAASGYVFSSTFNSYFSPFISGKAPNTGCTACAPPSMTVSFPIGARSIVFGWGTQNLPSARVVAYRNGQQVWQQTQSGQAMNGLYKQQFSHTAASAGEYFDSIVISFPGGGQANTGYGVLLDNFTSTDAYAALKQTGDRQTAAVSSAYAAPLAVTVLDWQNHPVANVEVDFSAPSNGDGAASATFAATGDTFDVAMTDANGVAVSSALTANEVAGSFAVRVSSAPSVGSAAFRLRNVVADTIFVDDFE